MRRFKQIVKPNDLIRFDCLISKLINIGNVHIIFNRIFSLQHISRFYSIIRNRRYRIIAGSKY